MKHRLLYPLTILIGITFAITLNLPATAWQAVQFLEPPYYGTTKVNCVFDHDLPLWPNDDGNDITLHYDGDIDGAGARSWYDQHRGIDYDLSYELVRASAPGNVVAAEWASPDHRGSYGLHVRIDHNLDNDPEIDYRTIYGHMSVLRVQLGDEIPANADELQRILGISGNTGWCKGQEGSGADGRCTDNDPPTCGAHLHFQLEQPIRGEWRVLNPYGWISDAADPWAVRPDGATSEDQWLRYPSITNNDVFSSSPPLVAPTIAEDERGHFTIDDGDADFVEETAGCWTANATSGWSGDYLSRTVPNANTCIAAWNFPTAQRAGFYHVFVHVPNDNVAAGDRNVTADTASYTITHALSDAQPWAKQEEIVIINQWVYPNGDHPSPWAYAGTYYFNSSHGTDSVKLNTALAESRDGTLAADAVRFSPVIYRIYLPLVLKRWPPLPGTPVLNPVANPDHLPAYNVTWSSADFADNYALQEATFPTFNDAITRYAGPDTTWSATGKAPGNYYYYRVRASNTWGNGPWSNLQQVYVAFPTATPTLTPTPSPTTTPDPCGQHNRLVNGNFEDGPGAPWEQFSNQGYSVISHGDAYSGTWRAYLGGFNDAQEWLRQSFVIPTSVDWGGISYWYTISTGETIDVPFDIIKIGLQNTPGNYLTDTLTLSNRDAGADWHYDIIIFNGLAPWAGQTLRLSLEASTDAISPTEFLMDTFTLVFFCDDTAVRAMPGAADFPTIHLPTPTPTPP